MSTYLTLRRIFQIATTNLKRNSYLSLGATGTIALTLLLFLGLLTLQFVSGEMVTVLRDKVDISVYLKTDAEESQILQLKSFVESDALVSHVAYVSREQALTEFKERHKDDQLIQDSLAQLDDNPLQASLNVQSKDPSQYAAIAKAIENNKFKNIIDKVNFAENEGVIGKIQSISRGIESWGLIITLAIAFIAVLVTFNTIRLTIYNQKQEIEIMRLVGASNWYIRGPYLAEGALYGLFAAAISLVLFYPVVYLISDKVAAFASNIDLANYFLSNIGQIVLMAGGLGVFLGVFSSSITISKHLKI